MRGRLGMRGVMGVTRERHGGGGSLYVYKKGTFLYRENGWLMHSNNRKGRWPRPPSLSP